MFDASVIIPAYNASETLNEAILSIDRASERFDGEVEKIIIEDTTGKGPSWARNRGLEKARGKVVFFCDADDTVKEDFFVKPYSALKYFSKSVCTGENKIFRVERNNALYLCIYRRKLCRRENMLSVYL